MTRFELQAAIWQRPVCKVAEELGVSDTWLRKLMLENDVQLPPRAWWPQLRAGHHLPPPPAPRGEDREIEIKCFSKRRGSGRPPSPAPSASEPARAAPPEPPKAAEFRHPRKDLALELDLLERDAQNELLHRTKQRLLTDLTAQLAAAPELDPRDWCDWLRELRAEVQQHAPRRDLEAWAVRRLGADRRGSR